MPFVEFGEAPARSSLDGVGSPRVRLDDGAVPPGAVCGAGPRLSRVADREPVAEELVVDLGYAGPVLRGDRSKSIVELGKNVDNLGPGRKAQASGVAAAVAGVVDGADDDRVSAARMRHVSRVRACPTQTTRCEPPLGPGLSRRTRRAGRCRRRSRSRPRGRGRRPRAGAAGIQQGLRGAAIDGKQVVAQRRVPGAQIAPAPLREVVGAVAGEEAGATAPARRRSRRWRSSRRGRRRCIQSHP